MSNRPCAAIIAFLAMVTMSCFAASKATEAKFEPLPLDVLADVPFGDWRRSFDQSPDGRHAAFLKMTSDYLPPVTEVHTATGKPWFRVRTKINVVDADTGLTLEIGGDKGSAWAPVWSPDGRVLAYFSDESGEAGLWTWDVRTKSAQRVSDVVVWSADFFETAQWSADGARLLCKVQALGVNLKPANEPTPLSAPSASSAGRPDDGTAVMVRRTSDAPHVSWQPVRADRDSSADLATIDLRAGTVDRIVKGQDGGWLGISPDGATVAHHLSQAGADQASGLMLFEMATREQRTIRIPEGAAYGWSWSPDSRHIAFRHFPPRADPDMPPATDIMVVSVADGRLIRLGQQSFIASSNPNNPLWDARGRLLYVVGTESTFADEQEWASYHDDKVWSFDLASGVRRLVAAIPGQSVTTMVSRRQQPVIWSTDDERSIWVFTAPLPKGNVDSAGLYRIDVRAARAKHVMWANAGDNEVSAGIDRTGEIHFNASDGIRPTDVWLFDTVRNSTRPVTSMRKDIDSYQLGEIRTLSYKRSDGQDLRASVLLPPGYKPGSVRIPLVVWTWGHDNSSNQVRRFPLPSNNMLALTTRGYAVLFPDMPQRVGHAMSDIQETVNLGVDAAVEAGIADPERLAVMGYSYGSYCVMAVVTQSSRFKAAIASGLTISPEMTIGYILSLAASGGVARPDMERRSKRVSLDATPWANRERYLDNSPFWNFDKISTPMLLAQGTNDGLTIPEIVYVSAVRLGKDVELRIYEDDHAISKRQNVIDYWSRRIQFLDQHLGVTRDRKGRMILKDL